jgi:hypothetical protein
MLHAFVIDTPAPTRRSGSVTTKLQKLSPITERVRHSRLAAARDAGRGSNSWLKLSTTE